MMITLKAGTMNLLHDYIVGYRPDNYTQVFQIVEIFQQEQSGSA